MEIILATNNEGKIKDFAFILERFGYRIKTLNDLNIHIKSEETGATFLENAKIKAETIYRIVNKPVIADDSGLLVDALSGEPGVHTARYGGEGLTDYERTLLLLKNMEGHSNRKARFVSAIYMISDDGRAHTAEGFCEGWIAREMKGENGFGYDPVFYVEQFQKTFGELSLLEKNAVSHRKKALDILSQKLMRD